MDTDEVIESLEKSIKKFKLELEREIRHKLDDVELNYTKQGRVDTEGDLETRTQHLIQMKEETDRMIEIEEQVGKRLAMFEQEKE